MPRYISIAYLVENKHLHPICTHYTIHPHTPPIQKLALKKGVGSAKKKKKL